MSDSPRDLDPRARRRPGLVALTYAYRALAGLLVALPAAAALGAPMASWPRGAAELFDPGAMVLVESLRLSRRALVPVGASAGAVAAVALVAGVFPLGALLAGLDRKGRVSGAYLAGRAWEHAGTLALITGLGVLLQALAGVVVMVLGGKVIGALRLVPPTSDLANAGLFAVVLAVWLVAGVLRDLAAAAAVRGDHGFYVATTRALHCARRAGGRALLAWSWRALAGLAGIVAAALLAPSPTSAAAIAAGVLLHQGAIAGATFARASWLAAAMRLYDATAPRAEEAGGEAAAVETIPEPPSEAQGAGSVSSESSPNSTPT